MGSSFAGSSHAAIAILLFDALKMDVTYSFKKSCR